MKYNYLLALAILALLASCQRSDDVAPDAANVTITVANPAEGQTFRHGDTVFVNAAVQYVSELHGYELTISDAADSTVFFSEDDHVHDDHFSISRYWVDTLRQPADLEVRLTAEIDHNGHEASKTIRIKSQP